MTTVTGAHTHVIQQTQNAHEAVYHNKPIQPDPDHLQAQQIMRENVEQTTVISSDPAGGVNVDSKARKRECRVGNSKKEKNSRKRESRRERDPDEPGSLLNTVA